MKNVPDISFKGYKIWATSELGELFNERVENKPNAEMLSVTMNDGIIKASENGRYDNSNSNKAKYKLVKVGDIAYNSMRMWQGASGVSPYEGIVSPAYTVLSPADAINSEFFSYLFKTNRMIKKFRLHSQGLTKDTWNLKYPALSKISVAYSSDENEQNEIASYFRNINNRIIEQQKKLEKLKQLKSASLISMFPQQGETVPRVRFKGFDGEWKKKQIGEIGYTYSGLTGKSKSDFGIGDCQYITFLNVLNNAIINTSILEKVNVCIDEKQNKVCKGDILFNTSSETPEEVGMCAAVDKELINVYLNSFCFGLRITDKGIDSLFFAYLMRSDSGRKIMKFLAQGATRYNLSKNNFCKTKLLLPETKAEQHQIASYFRQLDIQISEQEKRLEKLKQIKAACLDKMFV